MPNMPELATARLRLRPFTLQDAPVVAELCGACEIAATTGAIPHPYDRSMAEEWIGTHQPRFDAGKGVTFAIVRIEDRQLVGAVGMDVDKERLSLGCVRRCGDVLCPARGISRPRGGAWCKIVHWIIPVTSGRVRR